MLMVVVVVGLESGRAALTSKPVQPLVVAASSCICRLCFLCLFGGERKGKWESKRLSCCPALLFSVFPATCRGQSSFTSKSPCGSGTSNLLPHGGGGGGGGGAEGADQPNFPFFSSGRRSEYASRISQGLYIIYMAA